MEILRSTLEGVSSSLGAWAGFEHHPALRMASSAWQPAICRPWVSSSELNIVTVIVRSSSTSLHEASCTSRGQVAYRRQASRAGAHNLGVWHSSRQSLSFRVKRETDRGSDWLRRVTYEGTSRKMNKWETGRRINPEKKRDRERHSSTRT